MGRTRHPKKEVEAAVRYAEQEFWRCTVGGAHAWGKLYCPYHCAACRCGEFCIVSIWSTPRDPAQHARFLRRVVDNCVIRQHCKAPPGVSH
ncbi:hypothetical protein QTN24_06365 [Cupriavidus sp. SZY C1]|uniref:hypothetical protein n=1 Tax=Cupriavidus sp. SZY C1 TaxID=3055037 RepID=UPI0028B6D9A2|nr:hypothetical protein [Cupriavidus sp. SZY C1]MDT6961112.1 hypothetical protein [Cupriavidus sp. SZY C1]